MSTSKLIVPALAMSMGALVLLASAQTLSPGEVRITSRPYRPFSPALRVRTNEVQVGVVVRDGAGHVVSGLRRDDFAVYDNGKQQRLSSFSVETRHLLGHSRPPVPPAPAGSNPTAPAPGQGRYVALYFDDLNTKFGDIRHVQLAAKNFLRTGVGPNDKIALFTASGLQIVDFTPDASELLDAVEKLRFHGRTINSSGCPLITPYDAYIIATQPSPPVGPVSQYSNPLLSNQGSPTYQAVLAQAVKCNCLDEANLDLATCQSQQQQTIQTESQEIWDSVHEMSQDTLETLHAALDNLARKSGERVLVLASSGFLTGTLETDVDALVDDALRTGIVINALDAKGLYAYTETLSNGQAEDIDTENRVAAYQAQSFGQSMSSLTAAMADFAVGTGGRFLRDRNDLAAGYDALAAAPETEYLLGFVPESEKLNGKFHRLKVIVSAPRKFYVQARPGYFAPTKEATAAGNQPTPEEKVDAEVRSSVERSDFPLTVTGRLASASNGAHELRIRTHVGIQKLPFDVQQDRHIDMLTFVAALFDAGGKMVTGKEAQMQFALKPDSFARFSKSGINGDMSLEAPSGAYRLRVVAEEALHGEMSATTQTVQIR